MTARFRCPQRKGMNIDSAPLLSQLSDTTRRGSLLLPKQRRARIMMEHGRLLFKARDRAVLWYQQIALGVFYLGLKRKFRQIMTRFSRATSSSKLKMEITSRRISPISTSSNTQFASRAIPSRQRFLTRRSGGRPGPKTAAGDNFPV